MGIVRPVMQEYPYAWAFFIPFILVATFTMLNLFIAIIVNAMQNYSESEHQETMDTVQKTQVTIQTGMTEEIGQLREEILELKRIILKTKK